MMEIMLGRENEYDRIKRLLNAGRQGRTLRTQVMVRAELVELSGKAWRVYSQGCPCAREQCGHELTPKLAS